MITSSLDQPAQVLIWLTSRTAKSANYRLQISYLIAQVLEFGFRLLARENKQFKEACWHLRHCVVFQWGRMRCILHAV